MKEIFEENLEQGILALTTTSAKDSYFEDIPNLWGNTNFIRERQVIFDGEVVIPGVRIGTFLVEQGDHFSCRSK